MGRSPNAVRPMAAELVAWFRNLSAGELAGQRLERVYWYDGAFSGSGRRASQQRNALNVIRQTP